MSANLFRRARCAISGVALCLVTFSATPDVVGSSPEMQVFVGQMSTAHGFDSADLLALLSGAERRNDIIQAMQRPAEAKPWHQYRRIFLTQARIQGGVDFLTDHKEILDRAEKIYGVPAEVITAIIGVETSYGKNVGSYRVLDALATLGFGYPPRAEFFRRELEHFLLLSREESLNPLIVTGSYAGAMGMAQFISSSYRNYAVDFDGDGHRNLWASHDDAIGSVANYFKHHGWLTGQPVALAVNPTTEAARNLGNRDLALNRSIASLQLAGVPVTVPLPGDTLANLLALEQVEGIEYWVALPNFSVITRYNRSVHYAMAVYQLSTEIRKAYAAENP